MECSYKHQGPGPTEGSGSMGVGGGLEQVAVKKLLRQPGLSHYTPG